MRIALIYGVTESTIASPARIMFTMAEPDAGGRTRDDAVKAGDECCPLMLLQRQFWDHAIAEITSGLSSDL